MTARKRLIALVVAAGALVACTGCAERSSMAFSVDGTVVTENQVDQVAQSCMTSYNSAGGSQVTLSDMREQSIQWQLDGAIGVAAAKRLGISFSQDDRTQFLNQTADGPALMRDPLCQQAMYDFATVVLLSYQAGSAQFTSTLATLDIVVNPRFGTFDPTSVSLVGTGSLSQLDADH